MKKFLNLALLYAIAGMIGGVFYREFTKWNHFTEATALGKVHTHLFLLGMVVFLIVGLYASHTALAEEKLFRRFFTIYNIGVPLTVLMMVIRGITEVLHTPLTTGANAAISGIAGIGHILTGIGIVLLILSMKKIARD